MVLFSILFFSTFSRAADPVRVCLFDAGPKHKHEISLTRVFKEQSKPCKSCELVSHPIYDANGGQTPESMASVIKKNAKDCHILHLSWNRESDPSWRPVVKALEDAILQGRAVVAAAGSPEGAPSAPLAKTVMGQVRGALIIGELSSKGNLVLNSYHGKEMLTALPPPKGETGSSFSAMVFTAEWSKNFRSKPLGVWLEIFQQSKSKAKTLWPPLKGFFKN